MVAFTTSFFVATLKSVRAGLQRLLGAAPVGANSLRARLVSTLVPALAVLTLLFGLVSGVMTLKTMTAQHDRALLDPIVALQRQIRVAAGEPTIDLPASARALLFADATDRAIFQIRDRQSRVIAGTVDFPPLPRLGLGEIRYYDAQWRGQPVRVAAIHTEVMDVIGQTPLPIVIAVGETMNARRLATQELFIGQVLMVVAIAIVSALLMIAVTRRTLEPLDQFRKQVAGRDFQNLEPIALTGAPDELLPLLEEYNLLLQRLSTASDRQKQFISEAAHQLRTPLAGLSLQVDLLKRNPMAQAVDSELAALQATCTRTTRLATQLLALARVDLAAVQPGQQARVNLHDVIGDVVERYSLIADQRGCDLGVEADDAYVFGHRATLNELLANLIDNAIKYAGMRDDAVAGSDNSPGVVTIRCGTDAASGSAWLAVEDDGPGIPLESRSRVVERFYQVPGSKIPGSGLGLAIVRDAVLQHDAHLDILDPETGVGTLMRVSFPPLPNPASL